MSHLASLSLQNIQCFADPQPARLGRITLLVGENSTGKSTFMGCYQAFAKLASLDELEDFRPVKPGPGSSPALFDSPPYSMGGFATVARRGESSFTLAGTFSDHCHSRLRAAFAAGEYGQPSETALSVAFPNRRGDTEELSITRIAGPPEKWEFRGTRWKLQIPQSELSYRELSTWLSRHVRHGAMPYEGDMTAFRHRYRPTANGDEASFARLLNLLRTMPFAAEPMVVESVDPAPPARERSYVDYPLRSEAKDLDAFLAETGKRLGVFSGIEIREEPDSRRFSLWVEQPGQWLNIVDTGYGVHSLLPVLQAMFDKPKDAVILLQQPEVHAHPSAQAALADILAESHCRYVIETHSYHFIDRFRACMREGKLGYDDLSIIHFRRCPDGSAVVMQEVSMDDHGNIVADVGAMESFFGIWGERDGLDFQRELREEWT